MKSHFNVICMFSSSKHEEATTSGSEQHLDEIIVATIDSEISPIHYCDNAEASTSAALRNQLSVDGERNTVIRISSFDEAGTSLSIVQKQSNNPQSLDPSSAYKNSKMRRTEYSMRGIKIGCSNPSQDSAFGSMTDGELSRASSFKLSSFQSVSSPIDEGVEDVLEDTLDIAGGMKFIDSNSSCSSPCGATNDNFTQSLNDLNIPGPSSTSCSLRTSNIKETCIYLDPPKLMINDGNYIYTSSPIRKCATGEVFSQKYRVSSFEDMSSNSNHLRNQVCKKQSRSFEEEQRIESAFTPITSTSNSLERREKRKSPSLTRSPLNRHFTSTMTGRERSIMWKDSFLKSNKNNITIKSNESICDSEEQDAQKRSSVSGVSELGGESGDEDDTSVENSSMEMSSTTQSSRRIRNERFLFSLAKFKQNAIAESVALDTLSENSSKENKKHSNSSSSNDESNVYNATITSTTNDECNSEEDCSSLTESLLKTPSIEDVRKFVKSFDSEDGSNSAGNSEAAPLLGIEMLSISSSTDPE